MFRRITAYAPEKASLLGIGLAAEAFADRRHRGLPAFELVFCHDSSLDELAGGELVLLLPGDDFETPASPALIDALRIVHERGGIIASHCVGSFYLAASGLLDGKRATTHWRFAAQFSAAFPAVNVVPEVLYVDEGKVLSGAGALSGIDLYLYLIRREYGATVANAIAREIVVAPHREGGQAQYVAAPVPVNGDDVLLREVMRWAVSCLDVSPTVSQMAARALMSPRTFARRFKHATGTTPHAWLLAQRLNRVEQLLETSDLPIEEVARRVGYASATVLREQFHKRRGVPPRSYRRGWQETRDS